jgi:hypothetical protein
VKVIFSSLISLVRDHSYEALEIFRVVEINWVSSPSAMLMPRKDVLKGNSSMMTAKTGEEHFYEDYVIEISSLDVNILSFVVIGSRLYPEKCGGIQRDSLIVYLSLWPCRIFFVLLYRSIGHLFIVCYRY